MRAVLAWAAAAVAPTVLAAGMVLGRADDADPMGFLELGVAVSYLAFAFVGGLLAARRAGGPLGWLLILIGVSFSVSVTLDEYAKTLTALEGWHAWPLLIARVAWIPFVIPIPLLLLLFPSGSLPSGRWRVFVLALLAYGVFQLLAGLGVARVHHDGGSGTSLDNPIPFAPALRAVGSLIPELGAFTGAFFLIPAVRIFMRARRARGAERQQLKWFIYAAAVMVVAIGALSLVTAAGMTDGPLGDILWLAVIFSFTLLPVAIGIAVMRYRLYDIDVLINRTLVYGALTATLGAAYVASVLLLQAVLRPFTAQNELAVAVSTLAVVALFQPLRRRFQDVVDRRFYRSRYDAERTLDDFASRLRDEVDLDELRHELMSVADETIQPAHASVWLRGTRS